MFSRPSDWRGTVPASGTAAVATAPNICPAMGDAVASAFGMRGFVSTKTRPYVPSNRRRFPPALAAIGNTRIPNRIAEDGAA
jgi:hypothetical protein